MHRIAVNGTLCETTGTPRFNNPKCKCPTYADNLGPCISFAGGMNGRCVYCDHEKVCHAGLMADRERISQLLDEGVDNPDGVVAKMLANPRVQRTILDSIGVTEFKLPPLESRNVVLAAAQFRQNPEAALAQVRAMINELLDGSTTGCIDVELFSINISR